MSDLEIKTKILEAARENYFANGFSKSSMDDLAQLLGMSKKTIYKYFSSKDEIVRELTREKMYSIYNVCIRLQKTKDIDFLDRVSSVTKILSEEMSLIKPVFYLDVKRNLPDLWKEIDEFRQKGIYENFKNFILEGIELGLFRRDINVDVLVLMYANTIQSVINPDILVNLPLNSSQAYSAIVEIIFGGVFTEKGKEKYMTSHNVVDKEKEYVSQ
ncbi:MAG: TetR/AcrR family transcriptional regulator [Bacteroidetes bacterium]|nr:TetR/AcrR family transcriptional regulator [Bacteroidota bacterium]